MHVSVGDYGTRTETVRGERGFEEGEEGQQDTHGSKAERMSISSANAFLNDTRRQKTVCAD